MPDENGLQTRQAGKTSLENYDVEVVIGIVKELGERLIHTKAKHAEHPFRKEWLEQLVRRYRKRHGKPVVRLHDLDDSVLPILTESAREMVRFHWNRLSERRNRLGLERFRGIANFSLGSSSAPAKLRTWRQFSRRETTLKINDLEPYVKSLRISEGRVTRTIESPKLPIHLATPEGAKMLGYRPDTNNKNSSFTNKNSLLHEDYKRVIRATVGDIYFSQSLTRGGFSQRLYLRTNVGKFVTRLATVAGLDNTKEQKKANCPAPLWLFACDDETIGAYIGALWDAEGNVMPRDIKFSQAVGFGKWAFQQEIPRWPDRLDLGELDEDTRDKVYARPQMLVLSTALLLARLGIYGYVQPIGLSRTANDNSAYWQLRVHRDIYARLFREKVRIILPDKRTDLDKYINSTKRHK